ncbi:MAG: M23 family metallopeptidase [Phormidesmis sp. RL_2_1]|nr:M23 family metallopeptidase [Phormidesmis sp. RL_2_1]
MLSIPTVSLGSLCFSLLKNNLHLSEKNTQLEEMATEVKAEVDSLGEEIESLRERAGVPKETRSNQETFDEAATDTTGTKRLRPQGGPAKPVEAMDLLKDARQQMPKLNRTLDTSIKPALAKTLAEEAAYPDGQPVAGNVEISSTFGIRRNPFGGSGYEMHQGIDFVGEQGDIIAATGDGVVTLSGSNGGYGISVMIDHGNGYETLYAHMSQTKVAAGDRIKRGQIIGYIGSTGRSSGPHLHYSLYKDGVSIDPNTLMQLPESLLSKNR